METRFNKCVRTSESNLPRLVYVGDVPVESSYHGSALLYRLLQRYPSDRLRVIESMCQSLPERRLPRVTYHHVQVRSGRLLRTRFHKWASSALSLAAPWQWRRIASLLDGYQPEAILTVAHGYSWMTAAALAKRHDLPLHMIVHDDWPQVVAGVKPVRSWVNRQFQRCYREAASRLCVSPFMVEEYERRYGVKGIVLYPSRAADAVVFDSPPARLRQASTCFTAVFAGTINSGSYVRALQLMADSLRKLDGRLLIYGPGATGLQRPNIELRGLVSSSELVQRCRDEADLLFVPMSFAANDRVNAEIGFPSKLTDYTAMGLPLLIYGPDYCSAVCWARDNLGVAEIVTDESAAALSHALGGLRNADHRVALAEAAIRHGREFFAHARADVILREALRRGAGEAAGNRMYE